MAKDVLEITTVFSARLYGSRSKKNKKLVDASQGCNRHRAHKIKLQPTKAQEHYFARACGTARFAFNWALVEWQKEYEAGGKPGYPKFKRKGLHGKFRADNGSSDANNHAVVCSGKAIKLPRCGTVKTRDSLRFTGRTLSTTSSKQADGWYVAVLVDTTDMTPGRLGGGTVDVDPGLENLALLSTGEVLPPLQPHRALHSRLVSLSRRLSRKKKGNCNKAKAKTKLAKWHKRIADIRVDAPHKLTHRLATEFDTVARSNTKLC